MVSDEIILCAEKSQESVELIDLNEEQVEDIESRRMKRSRS